MYRCRERAQQSAHALVLGNDLSKIGAADALELAATAKYGPFHNDAFLQERGNSCCLAKKSLSLLI
jgi:hypothetical protein